MTAVVFRLLLLLPLAAFGSTSLVAQRPSALESLQAGIRHFQTPDYDAAIVALERALATGLDATDRVGANELLGVCYFAKADISKASEAFRAVLRDSPSHTLPIFFPYDVRMLFGKLKEESGAMRKTAPGTTAPPPPTPVPPPVGRITIDLPDFIEGNFVKVSEPQKVSTLLCGGLATAQLWQIRVAWSDREHARADALIYVVGGAGTLRVDGRDSVLAAGSFASVPRATSYALSPSGRNPLIILATLVGEPCTP